MKHFSLQKQVTFAAAFQSFICQTTYPKFITCISHDLKSKFLNFESQHYQDKNLTRLTWKKLAGITLLMEIHRTFSLWMFLFQEVSFYSVNSVYGQTPLLLSNLGESQPNNYVSKTQVCTLQCSQL